MKTWNILIMVVYILILFSLIRGEGVSYLVAMIMALQGIATFGYKAFGKKTTQVEILDKE